MALSLAERVHVQLRTDIQAGVYKPGQKLPSERELERKYRVSRVTVNRAMAMLNAQGIVERKHGVGTFVLDGLDSKKIGQHSELPMVKFISPGGMVRDEVYSHQADRAMHKILKASGKDLIISYYYSEQDYHDELRVFEESGFYGAVIWHKPCPKGDQLLAELRQAGKRFILMDSICDTYDCDYVISDNIGGARAMVDHLVEQGHRRIVYFTDEPDGFSSLLDRRLGFLHGLLEHDLQFTHKSIITVRLEDTPGVARAVGEVMARKEKPSAIFAGNDRLAFKIYDALKEQGLKVPDDVSLAGFDDIDRSRYFEVPLTTMAQNFYDMGIKACNFLLNQDDVCQAIRYQIKVPTLLKVRNSVADISSG